MCRSKTMNLLCSFHLSNLNNSVDGFFFVLLIFCQFTRRAARKRKVYFEKNRGFFFGTCLMVCSLRTHSLTLAHNRPCVFFCCFYEEKEKVSISLSDTKFPTIRCVPGSSLTISVNDIYRADLLCMSCCLTDPKLSPMSQPF